MSSSRDEEARWALIQRVYEPMRQYVAMRLHSFPDLCHLDLVDDVLHEAILRLHRGLAVVRAESDDHLHRLALVQVQRVVSDVARKLRLANRLTMRTETLRRNGVQAGLELEPSALAEWTEFHRCVDALPDVERHVFVLVWYGGEKRTQTAKLLNVSVRTVKRRWQRACRLLALHVRRWLDPLK